VWAAQFGHPVGTVVWSVWVESLADLDAAFSGLANDKKYLTLVDKGQAFVQAPFVDSFRQVVHGPAEAGTAPAVGSMTTVTTAVIANGKYAEAVAWGTEMAEHVGHLSDAPSLFLLDDYGTFGQVTWINGAADAAHADAANKSVNTDVIYIKRLGDVGEMFVPGSGQRALFSRIG
jgi:hypothetical protein